MRLLPAVRPTPEQLTILSDTKPGFALIRGAAGSGKTTTALLRLQQLCGYWTSRRTRLGLTAPVRVLVLTYNRTLEGYIRELAYEQVAVGTGLVLQVSTFARWAKELSEISHMLDADDMESMLRQKIALITTDIDFMLDEVEYVLGRFEVGRLDEYLTTRRDGRGTSPRMDRTWREKLLKSVIYPYIDEKRQKNLSDWNDVANSARKKPASISWDIVVVDEAQDFSANQVRAILSHLSQDHSVTFVIDAAQRVYPRSFTWKEAGITNFSSIHSLKRNYRNTKEIAAFARSITLGLPMEDDGTLPDFSACETSGNLPVVISGDYSRQIDYMLDFIVNNVDLTCESVAFLQPRGGRWFSYLQQQLTRADLRYVSLTRKSSWPTGPAQIALSTLHSAKGLEFDHVFIPGLNQQVTPHGSGEGDSQLDALRRLVAMGIGRARRTVMVGYKPDDASTIVSMFGEGTYTGVVR